MTIKNAKWEFENDIRADLCAAVHDLLEQPQHRDPPINKLKLCGNIKPMKLGMAGCILQLSNCSESVQEQK